MMTSVGHKQELPLHALTWIGMQLFGTYLFDLVDLDFRHCERSVYAAYCVDGFDVVVSSRKLELFTLEEVPPFVDSACTHFP
jgi:hypothetical protein